jgi:hypothetical protein
MHQFTYPSLNPSVQQATRSPIPTTFLIPTASPIFSEQPIVTGPPTISQLPPLFVNCPALSSGILPTSIPEGVTLNTIVIYSNLFLSTRYNFSSIQENLLSALQNQVGPLIAGCNKNNTKVGERYLDENNDETLNILFVVFKVLEKEGTQQVCPTNQNCPIVKMTIDVAVTKNNVEIYRRNRILLQEFYPVVKDALSVNLEKMTTQNQIQRRHIRTLEKGEDSYKKIVMRTLEEESGSLNVPGLMGITYFDLHNVISNVNRPDQLRKSHDKLVPIWGIISIVVTGAFAILVMFLYSHKARTSKVLNTSSHGEDDEIVVSTDREFRSSGDSDEESLHGLQFYVNSEDNVADEKPIEITFFDFVKCPTEKESIELDAIKERLSKSYHKNYYQQRHSQLIVSNSEMMLEKQGYEVKNTSFGSNRDVGPIENTVEL